MGKGYRGGSYKGLNLTFGKGDKGDGGILIRALSKIDEETGNPADFTEGPSKSVDKILELNSDKGV